MAAEQRGVARGRAVFILCDFAEAELQTQVGVAPTYLSWPPHTGSLLRPGLPFLSEEVSILDSASALSGKGTDFGRCWLSDH